MAEFGFEVEEIRRLIKLVEERRLERLLVEEEGTVIEILGPRTFAPQPHVNTGASATAATQAAEPIAQELEVEREESLIAVASPVVGVFYRSPSPDSAPFVEVGDRVEAGQAVGLIEAMKVFSEIVSDQSGIVARIAADSGKLVKQGEPLIYLHPE